LRKDNEKLYQFFELPDALLYQPCVGMEIRCEKLQMTIVLRSQAKQKGILLLESCFFDLVLYRPVYWLEAFQSFPHYSVIQIEDARPAKDPSSPLIFLYSNFFFRHMQRNQRTKIALKLRKEILKEKIDTNFSPRQHYLQKTQKSKSGQDPENFEKLQRLKAVCAALLVCDSERAAY
jgi:hypothetical protein